jgi:vacuolar-type H+-ATPase subunit E/Vma4
MTLEAILAAIADSGEAELAQVRAATEARKRQIEADAEQTASARREAACREALRPAAGERARRLHQAKLEALHTVGEIRHGLVQTALAGAQARLTCLRSSPDYALVLRCLTQEVIGVLGGEGSDDGACALEVDPRDQALARRIVDDLGPDSEIAPTLNCWGGLVAHTCDGRITASNTLEARLERATPHLRRNLARFFEREFQRLRDAHDHEPEVMALRG